MPYGMYISAAGADAQLRRIEVISNNIANVDTPGFKPMMVVLQARHAEAIEQGTATAGDGSINDLGGGVEEVETITLFRQGALRNTGVPSDMAIQGDGFFVVEKEGQQLLTRAGNFIFNSNGQLTTQQGYPVLGTGGKPIVIDPTLPWSLSPDGTVVQEGGAQIPLDIRRAVSLGDLAHVGENFFLPLADTVEVSPEERSVRSGYLEMSAVRPTLEMTQLIEASRAYEANIKMIQNQDNVIGSLVNRVLRQS